MKYELLIQHTHKYSRASARQRRETAALENWARRSECVALLEDKKTAAPAKTGFNNKNGSSSSSFATIDA
jgi:hypothetical protein